jgi:hypothetical protein
MTHQKAGAIVYYAAKIGSSPGSATLNAFAFLKIYHP